MQDVVDALTRISGQLSSICAILAFMLIAIVLKDMGGGRKK